MTEDMRHLDPSVLSLHSPGSPRAASDHFVEFYDDDAAVIESVRTFMSIGLARGDAAVIIAGPAHRQAFEAALSREIDLGSARERGLFASLDAEETLSRFMDDDGPNPARFDAVVGGVVERAVARAGNVRLFGEMVSLLWERGDVAAALALEELWNRLSERYPFRLFCAYPSRLFGHDVAPLRDVCGHHSHIIMPAARPV